MRGAAWATPVVSMSVAAPAVAASPGSCVNAVEGFATATSHMSASTPAYQTYVAGGTGNSAGKTVNRLLVDGDYLIEVTGTFTYSGTVNVPISELMLQFYGTQTFDWELVGTPTASSSTGGVLLVSAVPTPGRPADKAWTDITLGPTATGDGFVHPGEVITLEWVYRPIYAGATGDCGGTTARAYPGIYFRGCDGWEGPSPTATDTGYEIYEFQRPAC